MLNSIEKRSDEFSSSQLAASISRVSLHFFLSMLHRGAGTELQQNFKKSMHSRRRVLFASGMNDILGERKNTAQNFHVLTSKEVVVHDKVNQAINVI